MGYKTGAYGSLTALLNKVAMLASGGMDFIGFAYNVAIDDFIRLGAAQGIPNGMPLPMNLSPLLLNIRMVTLADNGTVYKEISWLDKNKYIDGTTVAYDGSQGQVMVELWNKARTNYTPYIKTFTLGSYYVVLFSHLPLDGYSLIPGASGYSACYMGTFEASVYNSGSGNKLHSIAKSPADGTSDVYPVTERSGDWGLTGTNQTQMDALAAARGAGWLSGDWLTQEYHTLLMMCTFGTYDIPGRVGAGRINLTGGTWTNGSNIGKCGLSLASAYPYFSAVQAGTTSGYATDYSFVLGVENPWGNVWKRIGGVLISDGAFYYKAAPPYDYTTTTGWTRLTDVDGNGVTLPTSSGYGGKPWSGRSVVLPKDVTGASSARMRDYYYYASGLRVLLVGGFSTAGTSAGPFCWDAGAAASSAASGIGGRLVYKKSE
jgi:hypothetical protein